MSGDLEWGPWVEHDGKGCPCVGLTVEVEVVMWPNRVLVAGAECIEAGISPHQRPSAWAWAQDRMGWLDVIRYRIRKPRALRDLIDLVADPYAPPPAIGPEGPVHTPARQPERVTA